MLTPYDYIVNCMILQFPVFLVSGDYNTYILISKMIFRRFALLFIANGISAEALCITHKFYITYKPANVIPAQALTITYKSKKWPPARFHSLD